MFANGSARRAPVKALWVLLVLWSCAAAMVSDVSRTLAAARSSGLSQFSASGSCYYYSLLTSQDTGIFAGSCSIVGAGMNDYSAYNCAGGMQTRYNITSAATWLDTAGIPNTRDTAYRADVLSDLMASMAVMYLESTNELPFARTDPISSAYLPPTYSGGASLINPGFPGVPITLNMLLSHTSSITETGFDLGAAEGPTGTVPTLATFVSSLFSSTSSIFSYTTQPGLNASYFYARTNSAIVSYVLERVLANSTAYSAFSGIGEFVFGVLLPPLGLANTFLLNRNGRYIESTYPFTNTSNVDMRPYKAVQDLTTNGSAILATYPIHASYFSDYMLYTTTADLAKIARAVLVPDGVYYAAIGARLLDTVQTITTDALLYATGRTAGLFLFAPNLLCEMLYNAVAATEKLPYCYFNGSTIPEGATAFGLAATGGNNEVALVCVPLLGNQTYCSVAELSFNTSAAWPAANAATGGDKAVGFAMVNLALLASDEPPLTTTTAGPRPSPNINGWYIFAGVVAALAVVVLAAFGADYFIQPPPPAKIIAPLMTETGMGVRAGTALTEGARVNNKGSNDRNGLGSTEEPVDGESPKNIHDAATSSSLTNSSSRPRRGHHHHHHGNSNTNGGRRSREMGSDDADDYGDTNEETPYILRSSGRHGNDGGLSSLRRRRHRPTPPPRPLSRHNNGGVSSDDGSYSTPDDGWGDNAVDVTERSSTGSQRPNPHGMLRFDAYI
ncbi:hypothetical protein ABB37_08330 [Leptomonas pyrrhocoris]|uniref:Beta-lactamase-related domain-containing protein n=1 Tax=Leptomonas pyrrhocoris TaxID=157538 RepID=A0A0N0DSA4_LEPPY|nr:hypothetical protein ABB37_08330 [Leptomonas pyrrhocoris]KPA75812.1 hypothetical protein ABB37_08330 [Leptomonas pyrrhocoris]|eukprot:XP_015654251.1 hypothetical protein ABB37_08330 [Leptomonas pyrrhocoris]